MKKDEIIAKLTELGIEHDPGAKVAELKALLPKEDKESVSVDVRGAVRTFTREIHGDEFESLAEQYADKFKGTIV